MCSWGLAELGRRVVYFDALFGLLALLAPTGGRRAGREDWDLLVAVVVSADLTPA